MTDVVEEAVASEVPQPLTPEQRALEAALAAARVAAAESLYVSACEDLDVEPQSFGGLSPEKAAKWLTKADAVLTASSAPPVGGGQHPQSLQPHEHAHPPHPGSNADAVSAYAGGVRVEDREPDEGEWDPQVSHVLLVVTRGNLVVKPKVPVDLLAPDVTGGAGMVIESLKGSFLQAQQQGSPTLPVRPDGNYGLRMSDGTILHRESRLRMSDFNQTLEDDPNLPATTAELVDLGEQARTEATNPAGPVGMGNPVVIESGRVVGKPVTGGQPAQPGVAPAERSQGEARLAPQPIIPGGPSQSHART
jgi:hypothetical protein